jgi:hypothetical protein
MTDIKYTKYNIPSECTYIVRTGVGAQDSLSTEVYKVRMTLMKYDDKNPEYRITNVDKIE